MINDFIACFIVDLYNLTIKYNESINQIRTINLFFFFKCTKFVRQISIVPYRDTTLLTDINFAAFVNQYIPVLVDLSDSILIIAVLKLFFHSLFRLNN